MGEIIRNLYNKLIFRDFLSFIFPGSLAIFSITAFYSGVTSIKEIFTFGNFFFYVLLAGLSYLVGFAIQSFGVYVWFAITRTQLLRFHYFSNSPFDNVTFDKLVLRFHENNRNNPQRTQDFERQVSLTQMCGNSSLALLISLILLFFRFYNQRSLNSGIYVGLSIGLIATISLYAAHRVLLERQKDLLAPPESDNIVNMLNTAPPDRGKNDNPAKLFINPTTTGILLLSFSSSLLFWSFNQNNPQQHINVIIIGLTSLASSLLLALVVLHKTFRDFYFRQSKYFLIIIIPLAVIAFVFTWILAWLQTFPVLPVYLLLPFVTIGYLWLCTFILIESSWLLRIGWGRWSCVLLYSILFFISFQKILFTAFLSSDFWAGIYLFIIAALVYVRSITQWSIWEEFEL